MNNHRPILAFALALVVVTAGFWGVLTASSRYDERLAKPKPTPIPAAQKTDQASKKTVASNPPANQQPKATPAPSEPQGQSKVQQVPSSPPKPASPSPAPSASAKQPTEVPKTGLAEQNTFLAGLGIATTTFLLMQLRKQAVALRPRNIS